jgi:hypothetical protein
MPEHVRRPVPNRRAAVRPARYPRSPELVNTQRDHLAIRLNLAALLPFCERVLGPEHPESLAARHQLASFIRQAGDAAGARDLFAALLPVKERVQGPEHPSTLATRHHLDYWMQQGN